MQVTVAGAMRSYDYDLPLMDVLNDPKSSVDRRILAGATVGVALDTAYLAISEMEEAFSALLKDQASSNPRGEGYLMLEDILSTRNPFQMRLWYLLHDTPLAQAASDLGWLRSLTYRRGQMTFVARQNGVAVNYASTASLCDGVTAEMLMSSVAQGL